MKYKLVIFDLDGTLLDTIDDLTEACNYALKSFGLKEISSLQTKSYLGNGIKNLVLRASNNHPQLESILEEFRKYYQIHFNDKTKPYPGIKSVIDYLKGQNIIIGVLSNKVENIAYKLIKAHFNDDFNFIYGDVIGRNRKPDPSFLLEIIKNQNIALDEVLFIGDSMVDVGTAKNAKVAGLYVSYGYGNLDITDEIVVSKPVEIINYLR